MASSSTPANLVFKVSAEFGSGSAHNMGVDKSKSKTLDNPVKTDVKTESKTEYTGKSGITIVEPTKRVPISEGVKGRGFPKSAFVACVGSGKRKAVVVDGDDLEELMMKELYEMGFYDKDTNLEILRSSNYDLDLSLDRLCDMVMNEEEEDDDDDDVDG